MNYFTFCWSAIPAHVHLFVHPYWESFYLAMLHLRVAQRGLPPPSRWPATCATPKQPLPGISMSPKSDGRKRWPVMTPLHYTCPQDHCGKGSLTPSFLFLRKRAHTPLQLLSLLKRYSSGCFSGVSVVLSKTVPTCAIRTQLCAEEVSVAACARAMARAGSAAISCYWTCCSVTPKQTGCYILGKVLFSSKTTRDLYSLQLYKHGVSGSRALYLQHWTSLSFPCHCHLKKHSQKWANPTC